MNFSPKSSSTPNGGCPFTKHTRDTTPTHPRDSIPTMYNELHAKLNVPTNQDSPKHRAVMDERQFFSTLVRSVPVDITTVLNIDFQSHLDNSHSMHEFLTRLTTDTVWVFYRLYLKGLLDLVKSPEDSSSQFNDFLAFMSERTIKLRTTIPELDEIFRKQYNTDYGRQLGIVWAVIEYGLYNAAHTSWALLAVIPEAFSESRHSLPTAEEALRIIPSTEPMVASLVSGQEGVYTIVAHRLRQGQSCDKATVPWPPYLSSRFYVTDDFRLTLKPEVFAPPRTTANSPRTPQDTANENSPEYLELVRSGCPATELIAVIQRSCNQAAQCGFFKSIDALISLPGLSNDFPGDDLKKMGFVPTRLFPNFDSLAPKTSNR